MDAQDLLLLTVSPCDKQIARQAIIHALNPSKKTWSHKYKKKTQIHFVKDTQRKTINKHTEQKWR